MMKLSIRITGALAVLALVAVACGDDTPEAPATTAPPVTQIVVDEAAAAEAQAMMDDAQAMMDEAEAAAVDASDMAQEAEAMSDEEQAMAEKAQAEAEAMMEKAQAMMEEAEAMEAEAMEAEAAAKAEAEAARMEEEAMRLPGEGVTINMGRADWATGYFQAAVYRQVLQELGYGVTDPADRELGPSLAYLAMAEGDIDFWVNSWYPGHLSWWAPELPDGSVVGDHLVIPGPVFAAGGLQGFLITKDFADEYGVYTMDELNRNADALAAYDAADPVSGNGKADIYGCQESWTCDNIIISQIAFSGWENIEQVIAGYDAMFAEATAKANRGEPMVIYTWTPSAYITKLIPGVNVYWLGMDAVLDDSNPANQEGGDNHDQRPGIVAIGTEHCPAATDSGCQLGWVPADITVTANKDFMEANPVAARLLTVMDLPIVDVSIAQVEQAAGRDSEEAINETASEWIANNRDSVDGWIAEAKAAA